MDKSFHANKQIELKPFLVFTLQFIRFWNYNLDKYISFAFIVIETFSNRFYLLN